jgi:putative ABC transport system substrate-binding protein
MVILIVAALAAPLAAEAQRAGKVYRIGCLGVTTASGTYVRSVDAFRLGLGDLGYVEGKNLVFEYRWAEGRMG